MSSVIEERARRVLDAEPKTEKTEEIVRSFRLPLNSRRAVSAKLIDSTHGTNFATIIQALRNANGQLAPPARLAELGIAQRTGESAESSGSAVKTPPYVSVGWLRNGLSIAHLYAMVEAGHGKHFWGEPDRQVLSEASDIPIIAIGDLVDPEGHARAAHEDIYVKNTDWRKTVPKDNPLDGRSHAFVSAFMDNIQNLGERLNIRLLIVWDPKSSGRDEEYRDLVKTVIALIGQEVGTDYSDISIIMAKELSEAQTHCMTEDAVVLFIRR